jgi:hypothetical protein
MINYNNASRTYDHTRTHSDRIIDRFASRVTESHEQIQSRFYNEYFPSLAAKERRRYPEIQRLVQKALESGFLHEETEVLPAIGPMIVTDQFLKNVAERNYSMFRLLDEREFADGLTRARKDQGRTFEATGAGDTIIWLRKPPNQSPASFPG